MRHGECLLIHFNNTDSDAEIRAAVDQDGNITLPQIGKLHVDGMTLPQVGSTIERMILRCFSSDLTVIVSISP